MMMYGKLVIFVLLSCCLLSFAPMIAINYVVFNILKEFLRIIGLAYSEPTYKTVALLCSYTIMM